MSTILTPRDHDFFWNNGYVVIRNAVPKDQCDAVIDALWEFLGMDRNNPDDWYRPPLRRGGMVEIYQHQSMWNNRQHPKVHQAFSELFGTETLWVSIDRANLKPPNRAEQPDYAYTGFTHWDCDVFKTNLQPLRVQGVLYLSDTDEEDGGFQCVPEIFRDIEAYRSRLPADHNPRVPDLTGYSVTPIPGKAGDLLIWHVLLPHGNGENRSDRVRYAQYFSMFPARDDEVARQERIAQWRDHRPPGNSVFPGDPRRIEEERFTTAELTELGRKLLGLDLWE